MTFNFEKLAKVLADSIDGTHDDVYNVDISASYQGYGSSEWAVVDMHVWDYTTDSETVYRVHIRNPEYNDE